MTKTTTRFKGRFTSSIILLDAETGHQLVIARFRKGVFRNFCTLTVQETPPALMRQGFGEAWKNPLRGGFQSHLDFPSVNTRAFTLALAEVGIKTDANLKGRIDIMSFFEGELRLALGVRRAHTVWVHQ
jgi:hypothetical protein